VDLVVRLWADVWWAVDRVPHHHKKFQEFDFQNPTSTPPSNITNMDSAKQPVKLVKVTRVLGRTGTTGSSSFCIIEIF
jgi:hypothetical protein